MRKPTELDEEQICTLHAQGLSDAEIAAQLGKPRKTVADRVRRLGLKPNTIKRVRAQAVERLATGQLEPRPSLCPVQDLDLARISDDVTTQMRVQLSAQTVAEYAEAMREGESFPPITVFQDNETYWPGDGWHRLEAARQIGHTTIRAEVRPGGLDDAIDFACQANNRHGLRPTLADRRKAIMTQLRRHPERPDREIARLCGCSPSTVGSYRTELQKPAIHRPIGQREAANQHPPAPVHLDTVAETQGEASPATASKEGRIERLRQEWEALETPRQRDRTPATAPPDPERLRQEQEEHVISDLSQSLNDYLLQTDDRQLFWAILAHIWLALHQYYQQHGTAPDRTGKRSLESLLELFPEKFRAQLSLE